MSLEELIRKIITAFLAVTKKRVLIFLSNGSIDLEALFRYLKECPNNNYDLVLSDAAKGILGRDEVAELPGRLVESYRELEECVRECDLALIPLLSRNTLCKVALGIADNLLTTGIAMAIMMGKEIIAVRDNYDPQSPVNAYNGLNKNPAYNTMLLSYEETLKKFGVKVVNYDEFLRLVKEKLDPLKFAQPAAEEMATEKTVEPATRLAGDRGEIITVADLDRLGVGEKISLSQNAKITPLALEYLEKNKIPVEVSEDK